MTEKFDESGEERDDPRRFPAGTVSDIPPEPVIEISTDPALWTDPSVRSRLVEMVTRRIEPAAHETAFPLVQLGAVLVQLGAVSVSWPLRSAADSGLRDVLTPDERLRRLSIVRATFPPGADLIGAAAILRGVPGVLEAEPVPGEAPASWQPYDPLLGESDRDLATQWYIFRIKADRAWRMAKGAGVVVADIDFGFRTTHRDLTNIEIEHAFNTYDGSQDVGQGAEISHGTAVLGMVGATANRSGIVGVAPESRLWPIQANTGQGSKPTFNKWAAGIDHVLAADSGGRRKVAMLEVQTSKGGCYEESLSTRTAIQQAIGHGVVVVVAAGNGGRDVKLNDRNVEYEPSGSILVGASAFHRRENPRACSSNYGERIIVSAPGYGPSDITCGHKADDDYRLTFGGTSGASPKVAAACALMLQVNGSLSHADVRTILTRSGTEVLTSPNRPAGSFLDVEAAVKMAH